MSCCFTACIAAYVATGFAVIGGGGEVYHVAFTMILDGVVRVRAQECR
jgi:hypothetical protein